MTLFTKKTCAPPTIFTTLFFKPGEPELAQDASFGKLIRDFGSFAAGSSAVQIASNFEVDSKDVVLQKTRWYAGSGNSLEQILKARNIDTVVIVCDLGLSSSFFLTRVNKNFYSLG